MRPTTPKGWEAVNDAHRAVKDYPLRDQVIAAAWTVVAVLGALRERFEKTSEERYAFDALCSETQAWLRREREALRSTKAY